MRTIGRPNLEEATQGRTPLLRRAVGIVVLVLITVWPAPALASNGGNQPPWLSGPCIQDGNPAAATAQCMPTSMPTPQTDAPTSHCTGSVLCDATWAELQARGIDTAEMQAEGSAISLEVAQLAGPAIPSNFSGDLGWNDFYLEPYSSSACSGTVTYNGYCGWLYNHYTVYVSGIAKHTYTTIFPGRSGDNMPKDHWVVNLGPLPNGDWANSTPTNLYHFHWGWELGSQVGFVSDTSDTYYPGKWPLDPLVCDLLLWSEPQLLHDPRRDQRP